MKTIFIVLAASNLIVSAPLRAAILPSKSHYSAESSSKISAILDYNYVCVNTVKSDALVFKTSAPQKIWRTTVDQRGVAKLDKGFELLKIKINADAINKEGHVASFKANLAKDYELKGLFAKDADGDLPLTVISSYAPDSARSQIIDRYNCSVEKTESNFQLGSLNE